jgi:hypothetical protein
MYVKKTPLQKLREIIIQGFCSLKRLFVNKMKSIYSYCRLLQIKVKCTIGKLKSSGLLSQSVIVADSKVKVKIWRFDILSWINKWFKTSIKVLLVEQELFTLPEHLISPPVFRGVRVTRSLLLYVCFVDRCLSFCTFSFGHCVVYVWPPSCYTG